MGYLRRQPLASLKIVPADLAGALEASFDVGLT